MGARFWARMWLYLAILIVLTHVVGCATVPQVEYAWQVANVLDTEQTVTIAHSPCLYEADGMAATVYGTSHPSAERVLATNLALATVHWYTAAWLDGREGLGWSAARWAFYGISFAYSAQAVIHNSRMGIRPVAGFICTEPH